MVGRDRGLSGNRSAKRVTASSTFLVGLYFHRNNMSKHTQWPVVLVGLFAGLFGSVVDSLMGAVLQFSGIDLRSGKVVERPGPKVQPISGVAILDNHSVNLLASLMSALCVPFVAVYIQEFFYT